MLELILIHLTPYPASPVLEAEFVVREAGGTFTQWGWRVGEFMQFQSWASMKDSAK